MKSCKEKAAEWGISSRSVNDMCKKGKVAGAVKENGTWRIPDDAAKPADKRISTGKYVKKSGGKGLKALPIGISDYVRAQSEYYYVDKTLLIKDLIRFSSKVTLFTRPRRFGKTLTMSMLQNFFDVQKDSKELFDGLKISKESEIYEKYRNQYPAIFVTLRSVEGMDFSFAFNNFKIAVQDMYKRHSILLNSSILDDDDKELFTSLIKAKASEFETTNALKTLINLLYKHYNKPVIVLIDEYDVPLAKSAGTDFYACYSNSITGNDEKE